MFMSFLVCDYLGEHLAYFFGITSPKYQHAINEYYATEAEVYRQSFFKQFLKYLCKSYYIGKWAYLHNSQAPALLWKCSTSSLH